MWFTDFGLQDHVIEVGDVSKFSLFARSDTIGAGETLEKIYDLRAGGKVFGAEGKTVKFFLCHIAF